MKAQLGELSFGPSKMYISAMQVEMCMSRALGYIDTELRRAI